MAYLKAYRKEKEKYPWQNKINVIPHLRYAVTHEVAKICNVRLNSVELNLRRPDSGRAWPIYKKIRLPNPKHRVSLGVIIHEVAHIHHYQRTGKSGHTGKFWSSLHLCYAVVNQDMRGVFLRAKKLAENK